MNDAQIRAQCEALLLQPLLTPLTQAFGDYGVFAAQAFGDVLARRLERPDER